MRLYIYCLVERLLHLEDSLAGIGDTGVQLFEHEGLVVVVSEFEEEIVAATKENILAHDLVVRAAMKEMTPLPFRFGTVVSKESLVAYIAARRNSLIERLSEVRDCVEMSVKIIKASDPEIESLNEIARDGEPTGPGTAFLVTKRRAVRREEKLTDEANEIARQLSARMKSVIKREQVTMQPKHKLFFAAAFLVRRVEELEYKRKMAKFRQERPDLHFLTSGPWPPYTFANIDLEFESHFGVS